MSPLSTPMNGAAVAHGRSTISSRPKEIAYVEDQLSLPSLWDEADRIATEIGGLLNRKSVTLLAIAQHAEKVELREREITLDALVPESMADAAAATKSVAARERAVKDAMLRDELHQELQQTARRLKSDLDQIEIGMRACEIQHRTVIAHMNSVSEYMAFLSAARNARSVAEGALPY